VVRAELMHFKIFNTEDTEVHGVKPLVTELQHLYDSR
jgi:hypothetical protein